MDNQKQPDWAGKQKLQGPFSGVGVPETKLETDLQPKWQAWKADPNKRTTGELLRSVDPVINTALQAYGGAGARSPTLRSKARKLALDAFHTYRPEKGKMRSHLLSQLRRLQRLSGREQSPISVPERVVLDKQHLLDTEKELAEDLGRDPSDLEIADRTGMSLRRIGYVRKADLPVAEGSVLSGDEDEFMPGVASTRGDDAWREFIYHDLGKRDQAIMDYLLGLHGAPRLPLNEVSKRLGLSPGAVSQRAARIQELLDAREELGVL